MIVTWNPYKLRARLLVWPTAPHLDQNIAHTQTKTSWTVAFLAILSSSHLFLDYPNLIGGGLDQFRPNSQGFVDLLATEWGFAPPPIQCLIRGHSNTGVITVVVEELDQCYLLVPHFLEIQGTSPQYIFQYLNSLFSLPIRSWVKGSTKA